MKRSPDPAPTDDEGGDADSAGDAALTERVASYHEQLLYGAPSDEDQAPAPLDDSESSRRWQAAKRVLDALARARRGATDPPAPATDGKGHFSWADFSQVPGEAGETLVLTRLGRFTIERELGRGGLSVVYLAHDPVLQRKVALKVPRPEALLAPEARSRFQREAQAAARLTHPHLVAVYEVGEAGPIAYIASAVCAGPNLAAWLLAAPAKLEFGAAAELVRCLAEALDYAHGQGVLHRDIKPSNVLLEPQSNAEIPAPFPFVPKLGDFGLARVIDLRDDDATRTGLVLGTPGYMSPEQAEGRPEAIGPATDVYGLGALLYELLVGSAPCRGSSHAEAFRRVVFDEPRPPRATRPEVPRDLEAICLKCLEKRPERRYASARELAADLRRFLSGEPTLARPLRAWTRAGRWALRRPAIAGLLGVALLAALTAAAFGVLFTRTLQRSLQREQQLVADLKARDDSMRQLATPVALRESHYLLGQGAYAPARSLLEQYPPSPGKASEPFAWQYLRRLVERRPLMLAGHRGHVYAVAFSPDETAIASAGADRLVRFWRFRDGRPLATLEGHGNEVNSLAFSRDGKWLYSVDDDGVLRLWDALARAPRGVLAKLPGRGWGLTASPDGQSLWCLSNVHADPRSSIHLWSIAPDGGLIDPQSFPGAVSLLAPIDDQHMLGIDNDEQQVVVYGREGAHAVEGPRLGRMMALASAPAHQRIAFGFESGAVGILMGPEWRLDQSWDAHLARIETGAFLGDELLATAANDGLVRIWGPQRATPIDTLPVAPGRLWSLAATRHGHRLAVAGQDAYLAVWNLDEQGAAAQQWSRRFAAGGPQTAALSADGSRIAVALGHGEVVVFDRDSGAELNRIASGADAVRRVALADDHRHVALVTSDRQTQTWDLTAAPPRRTFQATLDASADPEHPWEDIAFAPGSAKLFIAPLESRVREIDAATGKAVRDLPLPSEPVVGFLMSRKQPRIAVATTAGVEVERGGAFTTPNVEALLDGTLPPQRSPSGDQLIVVKHNVISLWRLPAVSLQTTIALEVRVNAMAMSPDGGVIAVHTADGALRLVDCRVREEVLRLAGFPLGSITLGFTPDGRQIICANWHSQEMTVRSWRCR